MARCSKHFIGLWLLAPQSGDALAQLLQCAVLVFDPFAIRNEAATKYTFALRSFQTFLLLNYGR